MKYEQLLSISLKHSYYRDGLCPDFTVIPQKVTETMLRNHRCVVKPKVNGINIYIPTDEAKIPIIKFTNGTQLSFNLRLKNPEFSLYTDFSQLPSNGNFQLVDTKQDQWFGTDVFATINIQRDFNKIDESASTIELAFFTKQVRWVYYLVTNQGNNDNDFLITFSGQGSPSFTWKQITIAESDKISSLLANEYPKMRRLCFVSEQDIPCGESGLKNIQLSFGQNKIFENLPSPPLRNYYRTNVDNTHQQADAIFTIVKSITNTTLTKV
ncbi:MAG: hypothetical protein LUQ28_01375 [Methylococcaceae bacterium]|nr:hypothetical protein [Methylococcaceae bacterium]MDD1615176.1 hypothetical protein [Methylococcaceae bacterium]